MKSLIRALMEKQSTPPFPFFPTPAVPMEGDKASLIILIEQKYYWHQNVSNGDTNKSFTMRPKIWGDVWKLSTRVKANLFLTPYPQVRCNLYLTLHPQVCRNAWQQTGASSTGWLEFAQKINWRLMDEMGCKYKINFCVTINMTRPQIHEFVIIFPMTLLFRLTLLLAKK